ncbi:MAG TPA: GNAT family N-acetyltransferase [Pseudonocardia sp.]|uniref:GNAT family N-acetyltransferase n=1 Tax=Pseudonocardia sp. TaxID=60912 RepID=UPI002EDBA965
MGTPRGAADRLSALVGRRVALRHRLPPVEGTALLTDAVGELADDGPSAVLVHTRRGVVRVARDAVVAVREIPPPMPRRPSWAAVARLERICADAWPPVVQRPLGQWRLRAAGGFTGRANSALVVGDPGMPVPDALASVCAFAAEHGVPPRVQVAMDSPWQRAITAHGWIRDDAHPAGADVVVLVAELPELAAPSDPGPPEDGPPEAGLPEAGLGNARLGEAGLGNAGLGEAGLGEAGLGGSPDGPGRSTFAGPDPAGPLLGRWAAGPDVRPGALGGVRLTIDDRPDQDWWAFIGDHPVTDDQRHVLTAPGLPDVGYGLARDAGAAVGAVRLAVVDGHLHVARLEVAADYRRRGLGLAMMRAAAQWAMTRAAANWCVLQVAEHNTAALALYRRLGFRLHHRYQYLRPN